MKTPKTTLAALSALTLATAALLVFGEPTGTPLAITNIAVNGGNVQLAWEEDITRSPSDLKLYEATSITGAWTEVVTPKSGGGASVNGEADVKFFRLFAEDPRVTIDPSYYPYIPDPEITWTNRISHTIVINLTNEHYTVTRLPADFCVTNDLASKTHHLYLRYITKTPDGTPDQMGSLVAEEFPVGVTNLNLSGYYIGVYAVTEAQYRHVMKGNPIGLTTPTGDDRPVAMISYNDIRSGKNAPNVNPADAPTPDSFLWVLSNEVYKANNGIALSFDLPTEAQWEMACRAGTVGTFSFTNAAMTAYAGTVLDEWRPFISEVAWWNGNRPEGDAAYGKERGRPVGLKRANRAGLYDMHGNVWEWCRDSYVSGTYPAVGGGVQPVLGGAGRSLRGGLWSQDASFARSAYRNYLTPSGRGPNIGFRICASGEEVQ